MYQTFPLAHSYNPAAVHYCFLKAGIYDLTYRQ